MSPSGRLRVLFCIEILVSDVTVGIHAISTFDRPVQSSHLHARNFEIGLATIEFRADTVRQHSQGVWKMTNSRCIYEQRAKAWLSSNSRLRFAPAASLSIDRSTPTQLP